MASTSGFLETNKRPLLIEIKEVPFVVRTVLGQLGWGNFFFDKGLATADRRKQLKRAGLSRTLEHRVQVKWRQVIDGAEDKLGVFVRVQVDDGDGHARVEELKDACLEVMKAIFARAEEVKAQGVDERRTTYGTAKWAQQEDLVKAGYVGKDDDPMRFVLGLTDDDQDVRVTAEDSVRHVIVAGPTGSGKTSRILIPNLIKRWNASCIVTEATAGDEPPDLYQKTSGFRKAMGSHVYYFNPDDLASHRINPIDQIASVDDAQVLANLIIENTNKKDGGGGEQIWDNSERHLLTALLLHAAGKSASLVDVRDWLTSGQEGMKAELLASPVAKARSEYAAFYNVSTEGFRNGVISGLMVRLNLWVSPRIAALTAKTDIDMELIERELFTLYLAVPAQKGHLKPLTALVFNYILSRATQKTFAHPIFLCLDEFTNFGRIPDFANKISIIRHRNLGAILGFQDYVQLEKTYGKEDAKNLWSNTGTKVLFKPNDLETAKKVAETLGTETFHERTMTSSGQVHEKEFGRALMNPGELLAMDDERAIVFTRKTDPIRLKTYTWKDFVEEMAIEPPKREKLHVDERLIQTCEHADKTPEWQAEWAQIKPPELDYIKSQIEDTTENIQHRGRPVEVKVEKVAEKLDVDDLQSQVPNKPENIEPEPKARAESEVKDEKLTEKEEPEKAKAPEVAVKAEPDKPEPEKPYDPYETNAII